MLTFEVLGVRFILGDLSGLPPGACRRGDLSDFPVSLHVVVVGGVGGGKNVGQSSSESFYCDTQTHSLQGSHMDGVQMGCGLGSRGVVLMRSASVSTGSGRGTYREALGDFIGIASSCCQEQRGAQCSITRSGILSIIGET